MVKKCVESRGKDVCLAEELSSPIAISRKSQAVADMAAYEKAKKILDALAKTEGKDFDIWTAGLYIEKSLILQYLDDYLGSIQLKDMAITIYERLAFKECKDKTKLEFALPNSFMEKANLLRDKGENHKALDIYDMAIKIIQIYINEGKIPYLYPLALIWMNKANAFINIKDFDAALALYSNAIGIQIYLTSLMRYVYQTHSRGYLDLAMSYMNRANILCESHKTEEALDDYNKAIEIYERVVSFNVPFDLSSLAKAYMNQASALHKINPENALKQYEKAIQIYEHLVYNEKHFGFSHNLAMTYLNKGILLLEHTSDKTNEALNYFEKAIQIYEDLIYLKARSEFSKYLADAYRKAGDALVDLYKQKLALTYYQKAIDLERLELPAARGY